MNAVKLVAPDHIHSVWPSVEGYLKASVDTSLGDWTADQLKVLLIQGSQQLLVITDEDQIVGATVVQFINYPQQKVAIVTALGGRNLMNEQTIQQVEGWAKMSGATKFRCYAKEAQARLYRQKAGFSSVCYLMEKDL